MIHTITRTDLERETKLNIEKALDTLKLPKDVRDNCRYKISIAERFIGHDRYIRVTVRHSWRRRHAELQTVSSKKNGPIDMEKVIPLIVQYAKMETELEQAQDEAGKRERVNTAIANELEKELGIGYDSRIRIYGTKGEKGKLMVKYTAELSVEKAREVAELLKDFDK